LSANLDGLIGAVPKHCNLLTMHVTEQLIENLNNGKVGRYMLSDICILLGKLLQSFNTCCTEVQLLECGVQIVVSDVGATIPGINSTEDKLGFLYEACSASLKVSLSFPFSSLQQQTDSKALSV